MNRQAWLDVLNPIKHPTRTSRVAGDDTIRRQGIELYFAVLEKQWYGGVHTNQPQKWVVLSEVEYRE